MTWRYKGTTVEVLEQDSLADFFGRLLDKEDFVATVYGPKNIGKSVSTIGLASEICPAFKLSEDVVFTLEDFYDTMENGKQKYRRVKILDDFGSELDPSEGMFDPAKHTSHYFQMSRTFHTGYFITTPNKAFINKNSRERIADYYIELVSKNESAGFCVAKIHHLQKNIRMDKTYNHCLCISPTGKINNKGLGRKVWEWVLPRPDKKLINEYIPLREIKGVNQLKRSAEEVRKYYGKEKGVKELADEIISEIRDKSMYLKELRNGGKRIDYALIEASKGIGGRRIKQLKALVEQEIDITNL